MKIRESEGAQGGDSGTNCSGYIAPKHGERQTGAAGDSGGVPQDQPSVEFERETGCFYAYTRVGLRQGRGWLSLFYTLFGNPWCE